MKYETCQKGIQILAEMNRVIFEGGGDYPANEFIIGSENVSCRYQAENNRNNQDQLTVEWVKLIDIIIQQCLELFLSVKLIQTS